MADYSSVLNDARQLSEAEQLQLIAALWEMVPVDAELPLHELRQARGLSQQQLADLLQVQQPSIAKLERRTDMYISTLRSHIEAMGGQLDIVARFPEGVVRISNFADLESD